MIEIVAVELLDACADRRKWSRCEEHRNARASGGGWRSSEAELTCFFAYERAARSIGWASRRQ